MRCVKSREVVPLLAKGGRRCGVQRQLELRIDDLVDPRIVAELSKEFTEFRRVCKEDGMKPEDLYHYASSQTPEFVLRKQRR